MFLSTLRGAADPLAASNVYPRVIDLDQQHTLFWIFLRQKPKPQPKFGTHKRYRTNEISRKSKGIAKLSAMSTFCVCLGNTRLRRISGIGDWVDIIRIRERIRDFVV